MIEYLNFECVKIKVVDYIKIIIIFEIKLLY